MKQLFNYCIVPEYEEEIKVTGKTLSTFIKDLGLDGIELMCYRTDPYMQPFEKETIGAHLKFWPAWYDFWTGNEEALKRELPDEQAVLDYYGATQKRSWLLQIKRNIMAALAEKPEYVVFHVSESTVAEAYSFDFAHSDREVVKMAAKVLNKVLPIIPENVQVLFENLWWPGLRLTDPLVVEEFFDRIKRRDVGIMLDTGHLMNTNPELKTEKEAVDFVCRTVKNLGPYANRIKGIHLSCSLSGAYQKSFPRVVPTNPTPGEILEHVCAIDQHRPFITSEVKRIVDLVQPEYLVHELAYKDFKDFEKNIRAQMAALK